MTFPFSIVFVAVLFSIIIPTADALLGLKSTARPKHKSWNRQHSETYRRCLEGQCVHAWKCPKDALSKDFTGNCAYLNNEPMVCCVSTNYGSSYLLNKTIYSSEAKTLTFNDYFKQAVPKFWKQTTTTSTDSYDLTVKDRINAPCINDTWYRTPRQRPRPVSSSRGISNRWNKFNSPIPHKKITNIHSTGVGRKTTRSWNIPSILGSRTDNVGIQTITKHPIFTTKRTYDTKGAKSTKSRSRSKLSTTTISSRKYTTRRAISRTSESPCFGRSTVSATSRRQTKTPKNTNRSIFAHSSPKSTRRLGVTTSLPNVNKFLCGTRNQRSSSRRQRNGFKPVGGEMFSDATGVKYRPPFQRIVGGEEAEPFSWPWVVALFKVTSSGGNRFLSAGSLISENFVLTAAHVFTPEDLRTSSFVVMLGTHNAQDAVAEYLILSVMQHPRYEQRYYYHDIALLRLSKPVVFNNYVMPVCLPSPNAPLLRDRDLEGKNVTVMGWGDESFGGKSSRVLKQATFPITSRVSCNTSYIRVASNRFPRGITNDMLCAGDPNGGKDACQGDSGGPLSSMENGKYTQIGIVSFGYQCGDKEFPGVYTKVAPYLIWITENIQRSEDYINYYDY